MSVEISGRIALVGWDEQRVGPEEGGMARAAVSNRFGGGIEAGGTGCEYVLVYVTEKSGAFTGLERVAGRVDGREGAFVIEQRGTFAEDGTIRCVFEVVAGSGSGALTGLSGTGGYTARAGEADYPYTFTYELPD